MVNDNCINTFSFRASRGKTIKPVWRKKVRIAVCSGKGLYQWGDSETSWPQDGGNAFNFSCQTVSFVVASAAVFLILDRDSASYPTTRDPHLPASPQVLRAQE
jgi:hypothetical protein